MLHEIISISCVIMAEADLYRFNDFTASAINRKVLDLTTIGTWATAKSEGSSEVMSSVIIEL